MRSIRSEIKSLQNKDLYSTVLFILYQLKGLPQYRATAELAYVVDKVNLLNLCEYFGGTTISIPTIQELQEVVLLIELFLQVEDGKDLQEAARELHLSVPDVEGPLHQLQQIFSQYTFSGGESS